MERLLYNGVIKIPSIRFLVVLIIGCSLTVERTNGLIHVVGGRYGWEVPPNGTFYLEWAELQTFGVGDELLFMYRPGAHNVYVVDKTDYDDCGQDHVIDQFVDGPTRYKLDKKGDYYFYSGIGLHCEAGQKFHIKVGDGPGSSGKSYIRKLMAKFPTLQEAAETQEEDKLSVEKSSETFEGIHFRRLLAWTQ